MATKQFKATWVGIYKARTSSYYGSNSPVRVGGSDGYNSYVGFNYQAIADAIEQSSTPIKAYLYFYVTDPAEVDLGFHKETADRKASGLPYYRYAGKAWRPDSVGWVRYDITSFSDIALGIDTFPEAIHNGWTGIVLYGATGGSYGTAHGVTNNSNHIYIEIEGTWNTPPSSPSITYPTNGMSLDGMETLKGSPATDSEQSQGTLRYQWGIFDGSWHYLPLTQPGTVHINVDFSQYKETSAAKVSLRAFDGELYGPWVYSPPFTINHNKPPGVPSELYPVGGRRIDRTQDQRFSWVHNDDDPQSAYIFRWRLKGETSWNEISRNTPNNYHIIAAGTLPVGEIEWMVQTFDQRGLSSPFSTTALFYSTEATNAPTIIDPVSNEVMADPRPTIQWSSVEQDQFEMMLRLASDSETSIPIWSISQASKVKGYQIGVDLANNTEYSIYLRVRSETGFWSDWDEVTFRTSFTPPNQAEVELYVDDDNGSITVSIRNPDPTDVSVPNVVRNEVYRRVDGTREFLKIANQVAPDSYFVDHTPASGLNYEYMVRSWGDNGTYMDSIPHSGTVTFLHTYLMLASDPESRIRLMYNPSRSIKKAVERTLMKFSGRKDRVAEYGEFEEKDLDLSFTVRSLEDVYKMEALIDARETLLYRDGRGRRHFVSIGSLQINEAGINRYEISFQANKVDYKEGMA